MCTKIISDPTRVRQVILNLATNAIKFTEKGEVVVRVSSTFETATHIRLKLAVSDTGIGISKEAQARLFGAFEQADQSTSRRYGGTGLGLAISKRIVALMGGQIGLESELGKGSTFWFEIEVPKQEMAAVEVKAVEEEPETDFWGLRILVVNESESFTSYIGHHLQRWNTVFRIAKSGKEALEMSRRQAERGSSFEFVVLDYRLPDMDGLQLAEKLSHPDFGPKPGMVLFTSFQEEVPADKAREAGILSLLTKPIKPTELRQAILRARTGNLRPLDLQATARRETLKVVEEVATVPPMSLLLVEDSPVNQEVAILLLEGWNHQIETAENGLVALEKLRQKTYDCVLMDCQMPEMDGYEATRAIRKVETGTLDTEVFIVAMTANAMPGDRERCLETGMNDYVGKPIEERDLVRALGKAVENISKRGRTLQLTGVTPVVVSASEGVATAAVKSVQAAPAPIQVRQDSVETEEEEDEPYFPERLVNLFISETRARIQDLNKAVEDKDTDKVSRSLHTIKGTAGNFKAKKLFNLAKELEVLNTGSGLEALSPRLPEMTRLFEEIALKLQSHGKAKAGSLAEVGELISQKETAKAEEAVPQNGTHGVQEVADDEEPYFPARLVNLFISETEMRLGELKESLNHEDVSTLSRCLHTIKGTAGNFHAKRLYLVTSEMELALKEGNLGEVRNRLPQMEEAFSEARNQLRPSQS
ncbi:MAG: response regulator [Blastochloris sp.]|nr:response regulator [Blastochloris sp.]